MSDELTQSLASQIIALEQRVRTLEDAKISYMIGDVNVDAQCTSEVLGKIMSKEIERQLRPGGLLAR
jgi:hypothetical protein